MGSGVTFRMYVRVLLLSVVLGLATAEVPKKIMHTMVKYNLLEKCWGQRNMVGYALGQHKAMEHCKMLSPMPSGFTTLPQQTGGNPWMTLPQPIKQIKPWGASTPGEKLRFSQNLPSFCSPG